MKKYDLWFSPSENSYAFSESSVHHDMGLEEDAEIIWSVEADSWQEACAKQHEYLGWEPYKPFVDPE